MATSVGAVPSLEALLWPRSDSLPRAQGKPLTRQGGGMIYRSWSLLSSTVAIWGGAAAAGLAVVSLSGGKVPSLATSSFNF
uniref:Uncharacterized protein n=1 Tax=Aegilops tauschii TaxID=37682 RepID=M8BSS3_AEGTA